MAAIYPAREQIVNKVPGQINWPHQVYHFSDFARQTIWQDI